MLSTTSALVISLLSASVFAAPTYDSKSCANHWDNTIVCLSETTFSICYNGTNSIPRDCALGTNCCGGWGDSCVFPDDPKCTGVVPVPAVTQTEPVKVVAPVPPSTTDLTYPISCMGVPNNLITCASPNTFTICYNNEPSVVRDCAEGTVCCGLYSTGCVFADDASCSLKISEPKEKVTLLGAKRVKRSIKA